MKSFSLEEKQTIEYLLPIWKKILNHNINKIEDLTRSNIRLLNRITKWEKSLNDKTSI